MAEAKQKPAKKAKPAAKAKAKAADKPSRTSSGGAKAVSANKTSSGGVKAVSVNKTSSGGAKAVSSPSKELPKARAKATSTSVAGAAAKPATRPAPKAAASRVAAPEDVSRPASETKAKSAASRDAKTTSSGKQRAPRVKAEQVLFPDAVFAAAEPTRDEPLFEGVYVQQVSAAAVPASPMVDAEEVLEEETVVTTFVAAEVIEPSPAGPRSTDGARATPTSPEVEAWAAERLDAPQRTLFETLRTVVRRVAPQATESLKWSQPVWERNGPFAFLRPARGHVTFGFWRGTELPDPRGLLEGAGEKMRHLKLRLGEQLPLEAIERFVREAVKRNEKKGSPTRRAR